jgi:hypothetical protein
MMIPMMVSLIDLQDDKLTIHLSPPRPCMAGPDKQPWALHPDPGVSIFGLISPHWGQVPLSLLATPGRRLVPDRSLAPYVVHYHGQEYATINSILQMAEQTLTDAKREYYQCLIM